MYILFKNISDSLINITKENIKSQLQTIEIYPNLIKQLKNHIYKILYLLLLHVVKRYISSTKYR